VQECLIGKPAVMKLALREAYADRIASARNPKLIARETMGVQAYFEGVYGKGNPRVYYARYKEIFNDNDLLTSLVERAATADYTLLG